MSFFFIFEKTTCKNVCRFKAFHFFFHFSYSLFSSHPNFQPTPIEKFNLEIKFRKLLSVLIWIFPKKNFSFSQTLLLSALLPYRSLLILKRIYSLFWVKQVYIMQLGYHRSKTFQPFFIPMLVKLLRKQKVEFLSHPNR